MRSDSVAGAVPLRYIRGDPGLICVPAGSRVDELVVGICITGGVKVPVIHSYYIICAMEQVAGCILVADPAALLDELGEDDGDLQAVAGIFLLDDVGEYGGHLLAGCVISHISLAAQEEQVNRLRAVVLLELWGWNLRAGSADVGDCETVAVSRRLQRDLVSSHETPGCAGPRAPADIVGGGVFPVAVLHDLFYFAAGHQILPDSAEVARFPVNQLNQIGRIGPLAGRTFIKRAAVLLHGKCRRLVEVPLPVGEVDIADPAQRQAKVVDILHAKHSCLGAVVK